MEVYRVLHRFGQAKFAYGSLIFTIALGAQKIELALKVIKTDSKILIQLHKSLSMIRTVDVT
jgi:hypothetical protein